MSDEALSATTPTGGLSGAPDRRMSFGVLPTHRRSTTIDEGV
jgi:hypothetical protein